MNPDRGAVRPGAASDRWATAGVVLAGGASRRMGADKARLELEGEPLLERALRLLAGRCRPLFVSSGASSRYADVAARHGAVEVLDGPAYGAAPGPLAGIEASLRALAALADAPRCLVVLACDLPRVDERALASLIDASEGADVCFAHAADGDHPLFGVYSTDVLPAVRAALHAGHRQVTAFLGGRGPRGDLCVRRIDAAVLAPDGDCLLNLNEPAQWESERSRAGVPLP